MINIEISREQTLLQVSKHSKINSFTPNVKENGKSSVFTLKRTRTLQFSARQIMPERDYFHGRTCPSKEELNDSRRLSTKNLQRGGELPGEWKWTRA